MYSSYVHTTQISTIHEIEFSVWKEEEMYRTKFGEY